MFGLFKKKNDDKDDVAIAIRQEFDQTIAAAIAAPLSKQARVGKGIVDALSYFEGKYSVESFQQKAFPEQKAFIDLLAKKQDELRLKGGDVAIEHIGYSLISRWVLAVAMNNKQLVGHFDEKMAYFKRAADTL